MLDRPEFRLFPGVDRAQAVVALVTWMRIGAKKEDLQRVYDELRTHFDGNQIGEIILEASVQVELDSSS